MMLKVLTANRLTDGHPVWYSEGEAWRCRIDDAAVAENLHACALLEEAGRRAVAANEVVDPALVDVEKHEGGFYAVRLRERIRAGGPTVA